MPSGAFTTLHFTHRLFAMAFVAALPLWSTSAVGAPSDPNDPGIYQKPPAPPLPTASSIVIDPTFGTQILRVANLTVRTKFVIGDRVTVTASPSLDVRATPSLAGQLVGRELTGAFGTVLAGPVAADGFNWWQIRYDDGLTGWSVERFLAKAAATDTTPPLISSVTASSIISSGGTISWRTNEASDSQVEYGTTSAYGSRTALLTSLVITHSVALTGLSSNTLYHYRVKSKDAAGNLATSGDFTFTTTAAVSTLGRVPLIDMGSQRYLGAFAGGLYENGNLVPADHEGAGLSAASAIQPLDVNGNPSVAGKIVLLSLGMSNTNREFCWPSATGVCTTESFMAQAAANPSVNKTTLLILNGAVGGQVAENWTCATGLCGSVTTNNYDRVRDDVLTPAGASEAQVQAVWIKEADPGPISSLPDPTADAYTLENNLGQVIRALKTRWPNVKQIFFSSRIYGGYGTGINPEPYAYESGFSVKWLIQAQIDQMRNGGEVVDSLAGDLNYHTVVAAWIAWGPYLWADGLNPRSDGLVWDRSDFDLDGIHPIAPGVQKVGSMLLDFFLTSPFTPWFRTTTGTTVDEWSAEDWLVKVTTDTTPPVISNTSPAGTPVLVGVIGNVF